MLNNNLWNLKVFQNEAETKLQNQLNEINKMTNKKQKKKHDSNRKFKVMNESKDIQKAKEFLNPEPLVRPDSKKKEIDKYEWFMSRTNLYLMELLSKNNLKKSKSNIINKDKKNKTNKTNDKETMKKNLLGFCLANNPNFDLIIPKSSSVKQMLPMNPNLTFPKRQNSQGTLDEDEEDDDKYIKKNFKTEKESEKPRKPTVNPYLNELKIKNHHLPKTTFYQPFMYSQIPYCNYYYTNECLNHKKKAENIWKICYQHQFYYLGKGQGSNGIVDFLKTSKASSYRQKWNFSNKTSSVFTFTNSHSQKKILKTCPKISKKFIQPIHLNDERLNNIFNYSMIPLNRNKIFNTSFTFNYNIAGNYRSQFIQYFNHRINWKHVTKDDNKIYNFQWKYSPCKLDFKKYKYDPKIPQEQLQTINVFEKYYKIGKKNFLFVNMFNYCNENKINLFDILPMTAIISNGIKFDSTLKALEELMTLFEKNKPMYSSDSREGICLSTLYKDVFEFEKCFAKADQLYIYIPYSYTSEKNYWIIKPVDLYQGKCIHITNDIFEIRKYCNLLFKGIDKRFKAESSTNISNENQRSSVSPNNNSNNNNNLNSTNLNIKVSMNNSNDKIDNANNDNSKKKRSTRYCTTNVVIQKYLDQPLLYNKRKFDIRCYVLLDYNLNVFFCREGHLKGCSEEYDINNLNHFVHITNYSLQKYSANFEKYELGNEMSYQALKDFLESQGHPLTIFEEIIKKMKLLIKISMMSVGKKFIKQPNVLSFQIFGYDFILDNKFHPWILEVNDNPGLSISSPVIAKLIPRMIDDAFRLTIDKIFETKYSDDCINKETKEYKSLYQLDGYTDSENVFEFLCNIK